MRRLAETQKPPPDGVCDCGRVKVRRLPAVRHNAESPLMPIKLKVGRQVRRASGVGGNQRTAAFA
jgi:hypothetical protein